MNKKENTENQGCSSIILQISNDESVVSFRREADTKTTIYINDDTGYVEQYRTNERFSHIIISDDGWIIAKGGSLAYKEDEIEKLAKEMIQDKEISQSAIDTIAKIKQKSEVAHFVIKSPEGKYAYLIQTNNETKTGSGFLKEGDYLVIPNDFNYFQKGHMADEESFNKYKNNFAMLCRYITAIDKFGVDKRNIFTYHYRKSSIESKIDVYVSNDDGSLSNSKTSYASYVDDVQIKDTLVKSEEIPCIMDGLHIGTFIYRLNKI